MGVEVDEGGGTAAPLRQRAQQRQGDAVVASERHQIGESRSGLLDQRQARGDVAERHGEVADIGQRQGRRVDPVERVGAVDQHPARLADGRRAEPGAAAVRGAEVERNAGDADCRLAVAARDAEEGRRNGVGRGHRHGCETGGSANRNTAAATAQVQSPLGAPSAAAVIDRLSTMRSLSA